MSEKKIDDGGPAFPVSTWSSIGKPNRMQPYEHQDSPNTMQFGGMTLRDYFAAKAMLGLCEGYDYEARRKSTDANTRTGFDDKMFSDGSDVTFAYVMAKEAYIIADAMMEARKS